jgi:4'-phosphopantetheinyl transferase
MNPARDLIALSEQAFGADDIQWLNAQENEERVAAFYRLWSIKEARYKLDAEAGLQSAASCIAFPHPDISLVLCSAFPLAAAPIHQFCG